MDIRLNLNENIKFKLTEKGLELYKEHLLSILPKHATNYSIKFDIEETIKKIERSVQRNEDIELQLHQLMNIFGPHLFVGCPQYIQDNNIILELK